MFYELLSNQLVYYGRAKTDSSINNLIEKWRIERNTKYILAFCKPTEENTDGFIKLWIR
jgi:hypothetical protein